MQIIFVAAHILDFSCGKTGNIGYIHWRAYLTRFIKWQVLPVSEMSILCVTNILCLDDNILS